MTILSDFLSQPATTFRSDGEIGPAFIRHCVSRMPNAPGVYRMLDAKGNALYVGKAKHLKNRVASYVSAAGLSVRIMRMVAQTASMEIVVTKSEAEALLLEANIIKRLAPRYNILLRDDKSFPFILLTDHPFPQITKHRGAHSRKGIYFGPFASVGAMNETISMLQKAFLLRPCSDNVFKNRARPCLQYQIKRCSAPCVRYIDEPQYAHLVEEARAFLSGKSREIQEGLEREMVEASGQEQYEQAATLRDRIKALTQIQQEQAIHAGSITDADVIALHREGDKSCIQVFFFRGGGNFGNKSYFPSHAGESSDKDIMSAFISQFYQAHTPPKEILLSHTPEEKEILQEALSLMSPYKVFLTEPQKGAKHAVILHALSNARQSLAHHLSERATQRVHLEQLADRFTLMAPPTRIEVYDNSHIMGTNAVGAFIVAGPEGFMPKYYRTFTIKNLLPTSPKEEAAIVPSPMAERGQDGPVSEVSPSPEPAPPSVMPGQEIEYVTPGDDYAMMRQVLTRRFVGLLKEDPDKDKGLWPDLVLIDGGQGQLSVAAQVFADLGVTVPLIAIAKGPDRNAGREWFFMPGRQPFQLAPGDPLLHYLERLRDEAHRFAIGTHRKKRAKSFTSTPLDSIPNIGPTRKKALLHHFGSGKAVETATLGELEKVEGISKKTAQMLYDYFRGE